MKYIAYCRKSTDESNRQILSIESQVQELKTFADKQNLEILEFVTEAKTAKSPGREKFQEVLKKIEKGEAQGILSWHPDRLARNSIDGGKIIYLLDTGKLIDLKFPSFWFENSPQGKFVLNIAFGQSKYYVDNLSENVKRGLKTLLRNGILPHRPPYGYVYDKLTKKHNIDPVKSKIIKKAFRKFGNGSWNQTQVAEYLFENGFKRKNGKALSLNNIVRFLTNRFYVGLFVFSGEIYQGTHETFISKGLFDKVQKQLENNMRPSFKKRNFAFIGLMKCGECGASITAEHHTKFYKRTKREAEYVYYRCTKKLKPCSQRFIQEPELSRQMRESLLDVAIPVSWEDQWLKWLERDKIEEKLNSKDKISLLERETKETDKKLNILLDGYLDGTIEAETYKQKKNELFERKLKLQEEISQIRLSGSSWLEPMREFINMAKDGPKIARAKNNNEEVATFIKNTGSNFFLLNRHLDIQYKKGFDSVKLYARGRIPAALPGAHSLSERDTRIELAFPPWKGGVLPLNQSRVLW